MKKTLLDVTRLYTRKGAATPSGIDRVDIRYYEHFESAQSEYVIAWLGCLFLADKQQLMRLHTGLKEKWVTGHQCVSLPSLLSLTQGYWWEVLLVTLRNILPEWFGLRKKYSRSFRRFTDSSAENWLYINTSHVQVRSIPALEGLRSRLSVDFLFFIHDLIPITHREYVRPGGAEQHERRLKLLLDTQASVVANSQYTKEELLRWSQRAGKPMLETNITVIPIGVEPHFSKGERGDAPLKKPYFLMLGTIEPRKNHLLVLNVWRRLVEQGVENIPTLVIIGKRGWENENIIDMLERCDAIQPYIVECQNVSDEDLQSYFQHCEALIYPSFVEGWGMPVAESLAMGVPVICSDIDVFKEVGQGCPTYIDPLDGPALAACIESFAPQEFTFSPPGWEAHFQLLDEQLQSVG